MRGRRRVWLLAAVAVTCAIPCRAQSADSLPAAPPASAHLGADVAIVSTGAAAAQAGGGQTLTLEDAEKLALQNHPQIQIAQHRAAYAAAQVKQAQSLYFPQANGSLTGVVAETDSRIAAGALNNPIIYDRFAAGAYVSQYVTDFGRTQALVRSTSQHARAQEAGVATSRADVLLQVREAYFAALKSKAVLTVAEETVKDRQLIADQVGVMAKNQLKSGLDVAFANVNLAQSQLLLIQAQNDLQSSYAQLSAALGTEFL
jgi:outer membrane protein